MTFEEACILLGFNHKDEELLKEASELALGGDIFSPFGMNV
jgi:hypothetical protein